MWTRTPTNSDWYHPTVHSTRPQHCCHFRPFWIRWTKTSVTLGSGSIVGSSIFFHGTTTSMDFTVRFFFWHTRTTSTVMFGELCWGQYHGGRRPSSDDSFHSPTVIPPSALHKPSIMKRYYRRRMCSHT